MPLKPAHRQFSTVTIWSQIETLTRDGPIAALIVGMDNLKSAADALGHGVHEEILETVARRLRDYVRPGDIVARLGGDEIAIVLGDVQSRPAIEHFARLVFAALDTPIEFGALKLRASARIGVASTEDDIDDGAELLRRAGVALNAAKFEKGRYYEVYEAQMDASLHRRQEIVKGLFLALAEETFEVHYQPVVHLATNEVIAFEALVRWRHATLGPISPAEFIPIAEELGLIVAIGDLVLRRACSDAARWPDEVKISVNFSRAQLELPDANTRIQAILAQTGFPARRLQLEVTESTAMANPDRAILLINELRALGIEVAIDDFGTGYSSLGCLRNCSFDTLKIDRAFIQDLATSLEARAILAMIVKLANTLGMHTIAEGVETAEQLAIVKEEGCGAVQGFFFSPAKPADEVFAFLARPRNVVGCTQTA